MKFSGMISIEGEDFESSLFLLNLPLLSENGKKKKKEQETLSQKQRPSRESPDRSKCASVFVL